MLHSLEIIPGCCPGTRLQGRVDRESALTVHDQPIAALVHAYAEARSWEFVKR